MVALASGTTGANIVNYQVTTNFIAQQYEILPNLHRHQLTVRYIANSPAACGHPTCEGQSPWSTYLQYLPSPQCWGGPRHHLPVHRLVRAMVQLPPPLPTMGPGVGCRVSLYLPPTGAWPFHHVQCHQLQPITNGECNSANWSTAPMWFEYQNRSITRHQSLPMSITTTRHNNTAFTTNLPGVTTGKVGWGPTTGVARHHRPGLLAHWPVNTTGAFHNWSLGLTPNNPSSVWLSSVIQFCHSPTSLWLATHRLSTRAHLLATGSRLVGLPFFPFSPPPRAAIASPRFHAIRHGYSLLSIRFLSLTFLSRVVVRFSLRYVLAY